MPNNILTLVDDIYALFENPLTELPNEAAVDELGKAIAETVKRRLVEDRKPDEGLRMSNLGRGDRQIYYDIKQGKQEKLRAPTLIKFLFGDILEHLLIFLAKEAGHVVTDEQKEVTLEGIPGHIDCKIDAKTVDTKSASTFSFKKFKDGSLFKEGNDPFGYVAQMSGYTAAEGEDEGYFLVIDKTLGNICLLEVSSMDMIDAPKRIEHMKEVVASDEPPPRCHEPIEDGKSGNMKLGTNCSYCVHKEGCWKDTNGGVGLRTFLYSNGPRYLTSVERVPDVTEVTKGD